VVALEEEEEEGGGTYAENIFGNPVIFG